MNAVITFVLEQFNMGLMTGIAIGVLLLCYPLLKRIFTAQQRVWLWLIACLGNKLWNIGESKMTLCDVSFQDLIVPRTGRLRMPSPAFLPGEYAGPGDYHIALPGGELLRVGIHDWMMLLLCAAWIGGMVALTIYFWNSSKRLLKVGRQGELLQKEDLRLAGLELHTLFSENTKVYLASGLRTSFVHCTAPLAFGEYEIFLQKELAPEQLELVLLHEGRHIGLLHSYWKVWATFTLVWYWWNPLVWLGFRCFCRDMELACDDSVMKKLPRQRRKDYAKALVELGSGRQLWEAPLAFGESDSVVRVKRLTRWKKRPRLVGIPLWCVVFALALFMRGGQAKLQPTEDMLLAWEREKGSVEAFVRDLESEMAVEFAKDSFVDGNGRTWEEYCEELARQIHIEEIWEAPEYDQRATLLVKDGEGQWYHVRYVWWGMDSDWIGVLGVNEVEIPDFGDCRRLI